MGTSLIFLQCHIFRLSWVRLSENCWDEWGSLGGPRATSWRVLPLLLGQTLIGDLVISRKLAKSRESGLWPACKLSTLPFSSQICSLLLFFQVSVLPAKTSHFSPSLIPSSHALSSVQNLWGSDEPRLTGGTLFLLLHDRTRLDLSCRSPRKEIASSSHERPWKK